jgi:hypothetical protein
MRSSVEDEHKILPEFNESSRLKLRPMGDDRLNFFEVVCV